MSDGKLTFDTGINTGGFQADADKLTKQAKGVGEAVEGALFKQKLLSSAASVLADLGSALVDFGKQGVQLASDLEEVQNVVDVTFGENAGAVNAWAEDARKQYGLTELQAKQFASTTGAMLKSSGLAGKEVMDMSTAIAGLTADMSSFYNIGFEDMFQKIRSGIAGEVEPLRQLGINMSVANLQAFAMSKGIKTSFQNMTQAEQTMLRYNYLMEQTADAQGDFARTSDSYANSVRVLETNMDTLCANIGEMLLPAVNFVVEGINNLFDAATPPETLGDRLGKVEKNYQQTAEGIATSSIKAGALINTIEELEGKTELTNEENLRLKGAMDALIELYPTLQSLVDSTTGKFSVSASAIREETAALAENALAKARIATNEEKLNEAAKAVAESEFKLAKATADRDANQAVADVAYKEMLQKQEQMPRLVSRLITNIENAYKEEFEVEHRLADQAGNYHQKLIEFTDKLKAGTNIGLAFSDVFGDQTHIDYASFIDEYKQDIVDLQGEIDTFSKKTIEHRDIALENALAVAELTDQLAVEQALLDETQALVNGQTAATKESTAATKEGTLANKEYAESLKEKYPWAAETLEQMLEPPSGTRAMLPLSEVLAKAVGEKAAENEEKLKALREQFDDTCKAIADRTKDLADQVTRNLDNVAKGFEKPAKIKVTKPKNALKNVEEQRKALEAYKANVEELKNVEGMTDEIMASISDGSEEAISMAATLASANPETQAKLLGKMTEVSWLKKQIGTQMAPALAAVDESIQGMAADVTDIQTQLTALGDTSSNAETTIASYMQNAGLSIGGVETLLTGAITKSGTLSQNVATQCVAANTSLGSVQTEGDELSDNKWEPEVNVGGNAITKLTDIKALIASIKSKTITIKVKYESDGEKPEATGLDYIPYNNFRACLHEGEAVLNKHDAALWRAGLLGASKKASGFAFSEPKQAAGVGYTNQIINFNVPVQTPDEFAQTMRMYNTYGLEGVFG